MTELKEEVIIGNWLKNQREKQSDLEISIIEQYCNLKQGELEDIENGINIDYITLNKLCGIYSTIEKQSDLFNYIIENINNDLSIPSNTNIINNVLNKKNFTIETEEPNTKLIILNDKEYITIINEDNNEITMKISYLYNETNQIDKEYVISIKKPYDFSNLLENIMFFYRGFYNFIIKPLIIENSKLYREQELINYKNKLFEELK